MKIRAQIGMVLNLDKCIGCHTCSVTCKQVWTNRPGVEYVWFNNVESKPGIGYPHAWENQDKWHGGWTRRPDGKLVPRQGSKLGILANVFANPKLPQIDDYYEPFTFDYAHLQGAGERQSAPVARPVSLLTGERMEKINGGPNWEDDLGGHAKDRHADRNLDGLRDDGYGEFERSFLMYLPRLCEHCLNPTCVASCPEGSIYKREEDGIVLVDQNKCKGWRMCISGCPYKKIYFNWKTSKAEKCIFCYPRIESGQPTICAESCVGRMRYLGVVLYDADRIATAAATPATGDLLAAQLGIFLDPEDPTVQAEARAQGIPESWLVAARRSPVYDLAVRWQLALPLHPEYRTLPMVWYVPPLSPIQGHLQDRRPIGADQLHEVEEGRIPVRYLANLLTAGDEAPVRAALGKLLALRRYGRTRQMGAAANAPTPSLAEAGLDAATAERMYQLLAIANYEDRFVLPTAHKEYAQAAFGMESSCGFADGGGCEASASCGKAKLFGGFGAGKGGAQ